MNRKILLFGVLALLTASCLVSCSKDDDESQSEPVTVRKSAPLQVMVVFAPGQLGDNAYADGVFEGLKLIDVAFEKGDNDTLDVNYIPE